MKTIKRTTVQLNRNDDDGLLFYVKSNYGPLLFDTGASKSQLMESKDTSHLKAIKEKDAHGIIGTIKQQVVVIESLIVGPLQQPMAEISLSKQQGILGMDFIHHYPIQLDLKHNQVHIIDALSEGNALKVGDRFHSYIPCEFDGISVWGLFDTGASVTIVDEKFAKSHPEFFQVVGKDIGTDSTGTQVSSDTIIIKSLTISNHVFDDHDGATTDLSFVTQSSGFEVALIIGTSTMIQKGWEFDYQNRLWRYADVDY